MGERRAEAAVALLLAVVLLVALSPAWERPESRFDEGFTLARASLVLDGAVPHRDFVSFYGPGNDWLLAGAFALGGADIGTERAVGALYRLGIVLGAAGVAASAGPVAGLAAGVAVVPLLLRRGFPAYASLGAIALALLALVLLSRAGPGRAGERRALGAGLIGGGVALLRPELSLSLAVAALPLLAGTDHRRRIVVALGALPGALALAVHAAFVGAAAIADVVADVRASGPGRRLPFDPFSSTAETAEASRLLLLALALSGFALIVALRERRAGRAWRPVTAAALLGLAVLPYVLSRVDYGHVLGALVPAIAAAAAAAAILTAQRRAAQWAPLAASALVVALALAAAPNSVRAYVRDHGARLLGRAPAPDWAEVAVGGRSFRVSRGIAHQVQEIADAAIAERRRGARTLFVGPRDLRRSNFNDAFLYYLLDDLEPASRYIDLNPWTANRPGSGLAEELAHADLLILNEEWDAFDEPNASDRLGSDAPNRVVRERFCTVRAAGSFELLRRCR